jgi:hypothetical protein
MLKYLLTTLLTAAITIITTLVAVDFQRERLVYRLSEPERLGNFTYRKLHIMNKGWQPATNVKIYLANSILKENEVQANPPFDLNITAKWVVGGFERIRRNESITVTFTYTDLGLDPAGLNVKSDETIAVEEGTVEAGVRWAAIFSELVPNAAAKPAQPCTPH